jgi:hypothetical protein
MPLDVHETRATADLGVPAELVWRLIEQEFPGQGWGQSTGLTRAIQFPFVGGSTHTTTIEVSAAGTGSRITLSQRTTNLDAETAALLRDPRLEGNAQSQANFFATRIEKAYRRLQDPQTGGPGDGL